MKTYDILKNIALAAVIMAVSVQCAKEEITPDEPQGSGKTVTLTVRSAGPDTRTLLGEGGKVMWTEGDRIRINGSYYNVVPDENDPSSATVSGVYESSEYMASYPEWTGEDENNFIVTVSQEQDYGDPADAQMNLMEINPMLGYTTGSELVFHNMAAIIRLGITGNGEQIERITLVRNDGEPVAGLFLVPKDDVKSGEFADTYDSFMSDDYYQPSMYVTLNGAYTELGPEPTYFYLAVAPDTYPEGFTVYVRDGDGNYAIQSTYENEDVFRSTITSKTPFAFKAFEGTPELSIDGAGPISLSCTVSGRRGAYIKAVAVPKTQWDEFYVENPEQGVEDVLWREGDIYQIGADGTVSFEMDKAYNDSGMEANMTPETEYVIVTGYYVFYDNCISNTGVYAEAATSAATGENPVLTASLAPGNRYDRLSVSIHAPEAASVSYALVSAADYGRYQSEGLDDAAIIGQCGRMMEGEILEAATGTGFSKTVISSDFLMNNTDGSSEFYQATEYVLIVSALSRGGMSSVTTSSATTSLHIDPDAEWNFVSEGSLYLSEYHSGAYYEGSVEIERMAGRSIYRFVSPMNQDEAFISVFTGSWPEIKLSDNKEHYTYLDLSDGNNVTLPPFENYIGFSTNSEDTGSQYELFLSSYGNYVKIEPYHVSMEGNLAIQYQDENDSGLQYLGPCWLWIEFEVPGGTGLDNSGSNESFDIGDEVQWQ